MEFKHSVYHKILEEDIPEVSTDAEGIRRHFSRVSEFIARIPPSLGSHAYAPGKWTVAQVLGHLVDTQAVFLYRILSIARGDEARLPGFDEARWIATGRYGECALPEISSLYDASAAHTLLLVLRLRREDLARTGEANGITLSAEEALIYLLAHEAHHVKTLRERYLGGVGAETG